MLHSRIALAGIIAASLLVFVHSAHALTALTVRPSGVDAIDFGQFNLLPYGASQPAVVGLINFYSYGGIRGSIGQKAIPLYLEMQCCARPNLITGQAVTSNFYSGDWLITPNSVGQPIVINFQQPVRLVGAQLSNNYGGQFVAIIRIYNGNKLLGSFSESGDNTATADNSAIFLGVMDTTADITRITYTVTDPSGSPAAAAINQIAVSQ
jgi:hypothetical protein